jgi:hypothetical protein
LIYSPHQLELALTCLFRLTVYTQAFGAADHSGG